jgi:hypothetical protein
VQLEIGKIRNFANIRFIGKTAKIGKRNWKWEIRANPNYL